MKKTISIFLTVVLICCYVTGIGENPAQDLPETWKQELALADEMGIRTDSLDQATVSGKEMMDMLDKLVAYAAPDRIDQWMGQYDQLRNFDGELKRFDAMGMCYLAVNFIGGKYAFPQITGFPEPFERMNWQYDAYFFTEGLFDGIDGPNFKIPFIGESYLDAAALLYNLARTSPISEEYPFAYDRENNTIHTWDPPTYLEAVLAVCRLAAIGGPGTASSPEKATDAEDTLSYAETAQILNEIYRKHYGRDSRFLTDVQQLDPEYVDKPTTRYFFAQAIFCATAELVPDEQYDNALAWSEHCFNVNLDYYLPDAGIVNQATVGENVGGTAVWDICPDCEEISTPPADMRYQTYMLDYGSTAAADFAADLYDRRDGRKVLELDENLCFNPYQIMTTEEIQTAVERYDNSFEPAAEMIPYEETRKYDSRIITDEMLSKETTLPDASCSHLPEEWRGILMADMARVSHWALGDNPDKHFYEYEIELLKEAGYNFMSLAVDFSLLQGKEPVEGCFNETRLKELDQVIAWCIERDIHVNLVCSGIGGATFEMYFEDWNRRNDELIQTTEYAPEYARLWKALAQRYEGISNKYLSFNLLGEAPISNDDQYVAFFTPAVEAIREASPDRCIIADVHCGGLKGEKIAQMGVALSYHAYAPRDFCAVLDHRFYDEEYLKTVAWPFTDKDGKTYDANAVLDSPIENSVSANELAAIAEKYNVGFIIGEWGIFGEGLSAYRYPDETIEAFLTDMAQTMKEKGYGWCYGSSNNGYAVFCYTPCVDGAEYEQVAPYALYKDVMITKIFQKICAE